MKYPYIGASKYSGKIVLFSSMSNGVDLDDVNKTYTVNWHESAFLNITPEYLANTYGEVVSPVHAEFIIELGKSADADISTSWVEGKFFNFYESAQGLLHLDFFDEHLAKDSGEKLITIPLPPKAERESNHSAKPNGSASKVNRDIERSKQSTTLTTEEETELESLCMVSALNNEIENQKTWPQVGDHALIQRGAKVTVRCIVGDLAWCACPESSMNMITVNLSNLSKPKSKEDQLIEELQTKLCNLNAVDNYILASEIIMGNVAGLSYETNNMSDTKD